MQKHMKNEKKVVILSYVANKLNEVELSTITGGGLWGSMTDYLTAVGHIFGAIAEMFDNANAIHERDEVTGEVCQAQCAD